MNELVNEGICAIKDIYGEQGLKIIYTISTSPKVFVIFYVYVSDLLCEHMVLFGGLSTCQANIKVLECAQWCVYIWCIVYINTQLKKDEGNT